MPAERKRKTKKARKTVKSLSPKNLEVNSASDIPNVYDMLKNNRAIIVLIWADYCGHCHSYKKDIWSKLVANSKRRAGLMSVHYDQLEKLPEPIPKRVRGYPTVFHVKSDGTVTEVPSEDARNLKKMNAYIEETDGTSENENTSVKKSIQSLLLTNAAEKEQRMSENYNPENVLNNISNKSPPYKLPKGPPDIQEDVLNSQRTSRGSVEDEDPKPLRSGGSLYKMLLSSMKCKKKQTRRLKHKRDVK